MMMIQQIKYFQKTIPVLVLSKCQDVQISALFIVRSLRLGTIRVDTDTNQLGGSWEYCKVMINTRPCPPQEVRHYKLGI